jgi:hypothetical protein
MAEKDFLVKNGLVVGQDAFINGTGAIKIPSGTDEQRPTPVTGMVRFNTTLSQFEGYDGIQWSPIGAGAGGEDELARTLAVLALG